MPLKQGVMQLSPSLDWLLGGGVAVEFSCGWRNARRALANSDLEQSRRFASTVLGAGVRLRPVQCKQVLAGRAVQIKGC